jgi:hypothetical protein
VEHGDKPACSTPITLICAAFSLPEIVFQPHITADIGSITGTLNYLTFQVGQLADQWLDPAVWFHDLNSAS